MARLHKETDGAKRGWCAPCVLLQPAGMQRPRKVRTQTASSPCPAGSQCSCTRLVLGIPQSPKRLLLIRSSAGLPGGQQRTRWRAGTAAAGVQGVAVRTAAPDLDTRAELQHCVLLPASSGVRWDSARAENSTSAFRSWRESCAAACNRRHCSHLYPRLASQKRKMNGKLFATPPSPMFAIECVYVPETPLRVQVIEQGCVIAADGRKTREIDAAGMAPHSGIASKPPATFNLPLSRHLLAVTCGITCAQR